jgi:mevalonate kinase
VGGVGSASGKLILFGEHAAVYGHPAVGISMPEVTTVRFGDEILAEWDLRRIPAEDREGVQRILTRMQDAVPGLAVRGRCAVRIESGVARMSGFGSSAALCGAVARAARAHAGEREDGETDVSRTWALAHDAERLFHGTPSGVDTGLSLLGGMCVLRPRPPALPEYHRIPRRGINLVVGALPRDAACAALVGALAARLHAGDRAARAAVDGLGGLAANAAGILLAGSPRAANALGSLANRAMDMLRELGLSTPGLDRMLEAAGAAGSPGAKLSGAGGGGAFFALARDRSAAADVLGRLADEAARAGILLASPLRVIEV